MKSILALLPFIVPLVGSAQTAQKPPTKAFRDVATHEELAKRLQVMENRDPMKNLATATVEDPTKTGTKSDFLKESDIICFNGVATFVPKHAILAIPANAKDRFILQKGSKIVSWAEFLILNRGWVRTVEVTRTQAEGAESLSEDVSKQISKGEYLLVATYQGGPISVLKTQPNPGINSNESSKQ